MTKYFVQRCQSIYVYNQCSHRRFVTVSEDALVIVWDGVTGRRLQTLKGHSGTVTCALSLRLSSDKGLLMTGSLDGSLRLWNLNYEEMEVQDEGPCVRVITEHSGTIQCLVQLGHNLVCSGGRDLCLWDRSGVLLDKFDRSSLTDTSDIHSLLRLDTAHLSLVAASDYKCLSVFDLEKPMLTDRGNYRFKREQKRRYLNQSHNYPITFLSGISAVFDLEKPMLTDRGNYRFKREQKRRYLNQSHNYPITFLSGISASFFASGCRGGCIIVWSVQHLSALKIFHCLPQPQTKEPGAVEFNKVSCIEVIAERYLFAAVGCGFKMYDVLGQEKDAHDHPKPLVSHCCAHLLPLTSLTFLQDRAQLVTVAEDKTVRIWGNSTRPKKEEAGPQQLQGKTAIEVFIGSRRSPTVVPLLSGELYLHAGVIKVLASVEEHGIVTGGDDGSIVLWKDGEREREKRDRDTQSFILGQSYLPE